MTSSASATRPERRHERLPDDDALFVAARDDDPEAVRRQVARHGGRVNAKDVYGWTALHHAASHGKPAAVEVLLDLKAPVNVKADDGVMPLGLAARWTGNVRAIKALIAAGA